MDRKSKVIRLRRKHRGIRGRRQALEIDDVSYLHELKHLGGNIAGRGTRSPMFHIRKRKAIRISVEKHQTAPLPHKDVAGIPVTHGDANVMEPRGELAQIAKTRSSADAPTGAAWRIDAAVRSILARFA